ncbi:hypothetical protein EJ110_NYTH02162 [Nymphaea thermarum]|nr:hypothetical protein EJ110_NYTH02162 [Nymphaea thermarum]
MGRRHHDNDGSKRLGFSVFLLISLAAFSLVYISLSTLRPLSSSQFAGEREAVGGSEAGGDEYGSGCCKGIDNLELWGPAVKWGTDFRLNRSEQCCSACKDMCSGDGPCLCNSWVFCGHREKCGDRFGECWLKKQNDILDPDKQLAEQKVVWTSGLIYGKGEGIVYLETEHGNLHFKLFPECAPHSVLYITELLKLRHCAGCRFHRAEGRGESWDSEGNHISGRTLGPPFALIQGTLETEGVPFGRIPKESCPSIKRGSVAWIGSGPEFFISLANHDEWRKDYTVFGAVLPEDMRIAEKIAQLPTKQDIWSNIQVSVLKNPVSLKVKRLASSQ